jgi:hypothetical protein
MGDESPQTVANIDLCCSATAQSSRVLRGTWPLLLVFVHPKYLGPEPSVDEISSQEE